MTLFLNTLKPAVEMAGFSFLVDYLSYEIPCAGLQTAASTLAKSAVTLTT